MLNIAISTGILELDNKFKDMIAESYPDSKVMVVGYREFLNENKFDVVILSNHLKGSISMDKIIFRLRSQETHIIYLTHEDSPEEIKMCLINNIYSIFLDPISPEKMQTIVKTIENPQKFSDVTKLFERYINNSDYEADTKPAPKETHKKVSIKALLRIGERSDASIEEALHEVEEIQENSEEIPIEKNEVTSSNDVKHGPEIVPKVEEKPKLEIIIQPKEIYKHVPVKVSNKLIVVAGLTEKSGTSFVAMNLARYLSGHSFLTGVIETPLCKPFYYDYLKIGEKSGNSTRYSYAHEIAAKKKTEKNKEYMDNDTAWFTLENQKDISKNWTYNEMIQLIYCAKKTSLIIVDAGNHIQHESIEAVIEEADKVFIVIDPMSLIHESNREKLGQLMELRELANANIQFILNKWEEGIFESDVKVLLGNIKPYYLPMVDSSLVYKSAKEGIVPYNNTDISYMLQNSMYEISKEFIDEELLTGEYKKTVKKAKNKGNTSFSNTLNAIFLGIYEAIETVLRYKYIILLAALFLILYLTKNKWLLSLIDKL